MSTVWCTKCGSDIEGIHYASCPDHPTNMALGKRARERLQPKSDNPVVKQPANSAPMPYHKSEWLKGASTISFGPTQVNKVFEYFINTVLDLDVEVVSVKTSKQGAKVTFSTRQQEVETNIEVVSEGEATEGA